MSKVHPRKGTVIFSSNSNIPDKNIKKSQPLTQEQILEAIQYLSTDIVAAVLAKLTESGEGIQININQQSIPFPEFKEQDRKFKTIEIDESVIDVGRLEDLGVLEKESIS